MQRNNKKWRAIFVQILFFGVVMLMLFFPTGWARATDTLWNHHKVTRPSSPGILTEEARRIPVLYTLHSAEQSRNKMEQVQQVETQENMRTVVGEMLEQLTNTHVLTQTDLARLQTLLEQPTPNLEIEENRFYTAYRLDWWENKMFLGRIWLLFSTKDHCAVEIFVSTEQSGTPEEILRTYSKYLGVDVLQDWSVQDTGVENTAKWHSRTGQATLFCTMEEGLLHLSITADAAPYNRF